MKILVLVKQVPDTWGDRKLDPATGYVDRGASDAIIDEVGERALEAALNYKDSDDATVVVATMGPASAVDILRKGLAMGADSAIHVVDDSLAGSDMLRTAKVLSAVVKRAGVDLIIAGNESTDGRGGVVPAMIAEQLGVPHATFLNSLVISESGVKGERGTDNGTLDVSVTIPAVISVTERAPEARFPNFRGIMKAKKKPLESLGLADLGLADTLDAGGRSSVLTTTERPARAAGKKIVDEGQAAAELADYLAANHLI
ncbi:electron transfer flavoprotein subunit beta/FixA family protein [Mycetocola zhadangensis]|uniref:electron transfer flavoprotein subunit beta/FixA family protein n=1 Tax=Mycetocola zhadangensis TaxID=1164595 RepID=UPI003A4DE5BE